MWQESCKYVYSKKIQKVANTFISKIYNSPHPKDTKDTKES